MPTVLVHQTFSIARFAPFCGMLAMVKLLLPVAEAVAHTCSCIWIQHLPVIQCQFQQNRPEK